MASLLGMPAFCMGLLNTGLTLPQVIHIFISIVIFARNSSLTYYAGDWPDSRSMSQLLK